MPKKNKTLCADDLRHAEYYGMQPVFDELYHRSLEGENFTDLMDLILSRDNILLAYRNIKANGGSYTAGTDNKNISDIGCLPPETVAEKVRFIVTGSQHGYRPKPVRRKDIPKPNGKTRPLGIPCIWDRLVQQCIKQVIEPICEAKFSDNSYGFRPNRSVEHAVQKTYTMLQRMNLHYVIEFDIKGFFDNVNHSKLMRQIWAMGIHDKQLIFIIKRILKAPIRMPDGTTLIPDKGTPQGGIISPLLANIVLNELDKWVESQWQNHPLVKEYGYERKIRNSITFDRSKAFLKMRKTGLKEMYIVRYADDFRIFCRNKEDALRTKEAVTAWITERLRLEVSPEKTRIVNVRKRYSEFLGFKIRVRPKSRKYIVQSHICDKKLELERQKLVEQAKRIARPSEGKRPLDEIRLYNSMVLGIQNYFQLATCISIDCRKIHRQVMTVLTNRLNTETGCRLVREGGAMTESEKERFGKKNQMEAVIVDYWKRIPKESFQNWYKSQSRYRTKEDRKKDALLEDATITMPEMAQLLGTTRSAVYTILDNPKYSHFFEFIVIAEKKRITKESFRKFLEGQDRYKLDPSNDYEELAQEQNIALANFRRKKLSQTGIRGSNGNIKYLTFDEASYLAKVSRSMINKWADKGKFTVIKVGSRVRIRRDEFEDWMEQRDLERSMQ